MSVRMRLLDWIVVIFVTAVLLAILSRSISETHGSSRRVNCQNNLRMIGLVLNVYESRRGVYPPTVDLTHGHSCFLYLIPELDIPQGNFNAYNMSLMNWSTADNGSGRSNAELGAKLLGLWRCPSSPFQEPTPASEVVRLDGSHYPGSAQFARGSYAVNWGGGRQGWGSEFERLYGVSRGPMNSTGKLGLRDVIDGAASTILVSEKKESFGWNVGGWAGSEFDVGTQPGYEGDDPLAKKVYSGSNHPGGVNVGFVDGSVRFLSNRMNRGVWYGLITRNGGEPLSLDDEGAWRVMLPEQAKR